MKLAIAYDEVFLEHVSNGYHPERPERLVALRKAIQKAGFWNKSYVVSPREATFDELVRVHEKRYVTAVLDRIEGRSGNLDPDTFYSPKSKEAALKAAGGGIDIALQTWNRDVDMGLALVRPPGHHAESNRPSGFCIFNNIAIAAAALHAKGAERIMIYDWDVHHGNGTQHQFELSQKLLYISAHAWPHFPGSGLSEEIGRGEGTGFTANVPFPHGATDVDYAEVIDRLVVPLTRAFKPDIIMISAGFDAHCNDMLGGMEVTESGFAYQAQAIRDLANELCNGKIVLFLEGGYDLDGLASSMVESLLVFDGMNVHRPQGTPGPRYQRTLESTLECLRPYWHGVL